MRLVGLAATTLVTAALAAPIDIGTGSSLARRNFFGDIWNGATTILGGLSNGGGSSSSRGTSGNQAASTRPAPPSNLVAYVSDLPTGQGSDGSTSQTSSRQSRYSQTSGLRDSTSADYDYSSAYSRYPTTDDYSTGSETKTNTLTKIGNVISALGGGDRGSTTKTKTSYRQSLYDPTQDSQYTYPDYTTQGSNAQDSQYLGQGDGSTRKARKQKLQSDGRSPYSYQTGQTSPTDSSQPTTPDAVNYSPSRRPSRDTATTTTTTTTGSGDRTGSIKKYSSGDVPGFVDSNTRGQGSSGNGRSADAARLSSTNI